MKKYICLLLCSLIILSLFTACKGENKKSQKLNIVVTTFPQYDWVKNILGDTADSAELTLLINNGIDLHSFQPSAADIVKVSSCDMFIYVGGASDDWVGDALKTASNKNMIAINLLETLGDKAKAEEIVEGMEAEKEEEDGDEAEYDEHVWLSLKNAEFFCQKIAEGLSKLKPENQKAYSDNLEKYLEKLDKVDKDYTAVCENAAQKTLLFGDRFPFRYLVDDYGLKYYAAFVGCSAETEASFETVSFLSGKIDELGLKTVLTIEGTNHKLAETVIKNSKSQNAKILTVDSIQSITSSDVEKGADYIDIMEKNLEVLKEALEVYG